MEGAPALEESPLPAVAAVSEDRLEGLSDQGEAGGRRVRSLVQVARAPAPSPSAPPRQSVAELVMAAQGLGNLHAGRPGPLQPLHFLLRPVRRQWVFQESGTQAWGESLTDFLMSV